MKDKTKGICEAIIFWIIVYGVAVGLGVLIGLSPANIFLTLFSLTLILGIIGILSL